VDYEIGYQFVHDGPDGWITGLVVGHDFTPKIEGDVEFYSQGVFHPAGIQPTIDFGGRSRSRTQSFFCSWPDAASNLPASSSRHSSAISVCNFCFPRNLINPINSYS
jgi:hypothetical protein